MGPPQDWIHSVPEKCTTSADLSKFMFFLQPTIIIKNTLQHNMIIIIVTININYLFQL